MSLDTKIDFSTFVNFIDNAYDEIFIWDERSRIVYANKACYRHYGRPPEYFIGKSLSDCLSKEKFWNPSSLPYVYNERRPVVQSQKTFLGIDVLTISVPILDDEGVVRYIVQTIRDDVDTLFRMLSPLTGAESDPLSGKHDSFICKDESMLRILNSIQKLNQVKAPLLILGETGTGKSLLARYAHQISYRKGKPFVSLNMASLSPAVIESELFGYKKGAFTGANQKGKKGLFEMANGGTLFLDEIGELPFSLQAKFLHAIQEEEIIPLGGTEAVHLDVRIISATNSDLGKMVSAGLFREDLYHRLNVFEVTIPPLRERKADILLLTSHFLNLYNNKYEKSVSFSDNVLGMFLKHAWKGNIRELSNIIERSVLMAEGAYLETKELPSSFFSVDNIVYNHENTRDIPSEDVDFEDAVSRFEAGIIRRAFKKYGSTRKVAQALRLTQTKAHRLIGKYAGGQ